MKWALRLFGLGSFLAGAAPYITGAKWPFLCNSALCTIGTTVISPARALMLIGILLMFFSLLFRKQKIGY